LPALESSHALAYLEKMGDLIKGKVVVVCLSGRGDKDVGVVSQSLGEEIKAI
jgi:tryptophan synthase beta chain